MLPGYDNAAVHVTGLLRTGGRYLFANGLHALAVVIALMLSPGSATGARLRKKRTAGR